MWSICESAGPSVSRLRIRGSRALGATFVLLRPKDSSLARILVNF